MGKQVKIEIMDTTLRDGEQTSGVSFVPHEKLMIARLLLEELKVDRVEVASARVSDGEADAVRMICDWAARRGLLQRVEVLGFVDGHASVDWIHAAGCRVINLLCKGSLKHCTYQLKKTPEEHIADIELSARERADALDAATRERLQAMIAACRGHCEQVLSTLGATCESVSNELKRADAAVAQLPEAFTTLVGQLDELKKLEQ